MDIQQDSSKLELVKTIIQLAAIFKLDAIAEGIETETQRDLLIGLDCQYGQGYFFSEPLSQDKIECLLIDSPSLCWQNLV